MRLVAPNAFNIETVCVILTACLPINLMVVPHPSYVLFDLV